MKRILLVMACLAVVASFAMASGQSGATEAKTWVLKYNQLEPPVHPQGVTQTAF